MAIISDTKDLGAFIRRKRKERGYTQAQLAELAGVGVVYVSQLENGKETAEIGKALRLLQLLSVDLEATDRQDRSEPGSMASVLSGIRRAGDTVPLEGEHNLRDVVTSAQDTYLAFPAFLGNDGKTHVQNADQAFWFRYRSEGAADQSSGEA